MDFKQFIRVFVCIVLVCILVFNCSPLRAQALEPISTALGIGVAALLLLGTAGILFNPTSNAQIEAIGNSMQTYLYQWGTSAEKLDDVDEFFGGLTLYEGSPDDDGDDDTPHERQFKIGQAIKTGIAAWLVSIASGSTKVEDSESAPNDSFVVDMTGWTSTVNIQFGETSYEFKPFYADQLFSAPMAFKTISTGSDGKSTYAVFVGVLSNYKLCYCNNASVNLKTTFSDQYSYWINAACHEDFIEDWDKLLTYPYNCIDLGTFDGNSPYAALVKSAVSNATVSGSSAAAYLEPRYVGDIPDGIKDGSITEDNLELPNLIDYSTLAGADAGLVSGVTGLLQNVSNGTTTYDDYLSMLQPVPVPDTDPEPATEPSEPIIPVPDLDDTPLSDVKANVFFDTLTDIITAPFKWIWEKLDTKLDTLKPLGFDFDRLTEIITAPFRWIWEKIETVILPAIRAIPDAIAEVVTSIQSFSNSMNDKIADAVAETKAAIESLVVPDEDYLSDKIAALCEEFAFADSIVRTTQQLGNMLAGVTTEPPVIYIDLGSTRGSYDIGGVVPFLDLRWYAEYKPTVDAIISAFLWVCFIWRMFLKLPGIINGAAGDFVLIQSRREDYFNDR